MNRKFITHNIKKVKDERIKELNIQQYKIKFKPKRDRPNLQKILKSRVSEVRRFTKRLNSFFNQTQEFKNVKRPNR